MKSLKLNKLRTNELSKKQMSSVTGGVMQPTCTCGCCYADNGGSSTSDNMAANYDGGLTSRCDDSFPIYY